MVQWFTRQTSHMISLTFGCHGEERSHLVAVLLLSAVRLGVPHVCIYIFASCRFSPPEGHHISDRLYKLNTLTLQFWTEATYKRNTKH